ncbi:ABC transporter permease [Ketogulonicigenium vulgare]|uniref:ABC transporter permease n=1 Tax=Ketogulonicigenium vulgare TaxID=92945 RepID=UPI002358AA40|nr:ABC transporter permease [Ketogulonicigenium vulgare]
MTQKVHPLLIAFTVIVFIFLLAPLIIILGAAVSDTTYLTFPPQGFTLHWFQNAFDISAFRRTAITSFTLAIVGTGISMLIGIPAAYALARYRVQIPKFLGNIYVLPILIPEIVLGFSLMKSVAIGANVPLMTVLVLAHALIVLPYCVRVVGASLNSFDFSIEEAAVSLGSPRWKAFFTVVLPNIRAGIIAGFILAFITSLNDVSVSIFLTGPGVSTLPIQLLAHMEQFFDPTIASVSVLLMFVTVIVMALVERTLGLTFLTK